MPTPMGEQQDYSAMAVQTDGSQKLHDELSGECNKDTEWHDGSSRPASDIRLLVTRGI